MAVRDFGKAKTAQIGDQSIKPNCLFRSAADEDFYKFVNLHIPSSLCIIDFRHSSETAQEKLNVDYQQNWNNIIIWPESNDAYTQNIRGSEETDRETPSKLLDSTMCGFYESFAKEDVAWRKVINILLSSNYEKYIFICRRGVDRTGVAVSLVLRLLSVSIVEIQKEYLRFSGDRIPPKELYINHFWSSILLKYGTFDNFVQIALGLDIDLQRKFVDKFSEREGT